MELQCLAKKSSQAQLCDIMHWGAEGSPGDQEKAAVGRAALCCQKHCESVPRAAVVERSRPHPSPEAPSSQRDSATLPAFFPEGPPSNSHMTLERKVCQCCSQEVETSFIYVDENVNLEQRARRSPQQKGAIALETLTGEIQVTGPTRLPYP